MDDGENPQPDRSNPEQAHHRRLPRSGRRRKARNRVYAGREQYRPRGDARDPELPERADRPVGWRRARAVPRRLRLFEPAARRMGAREADHEPRKGGAPADLRLGLDLRPYDRGLLRPGMTADITIFDPDTVKPLPEFIVHDFPAGGWRYKEPAAGIYATFVNGRMLMKEGEHTGNLPGRVLRNSRYQAVQG